MSVPQRAFLGELCDTPGVRCKPIATHRNISLSSGCMMLFCPRHERLSTTTAPRRSAHDSVAALSRDIVDWVETWNKDPKPFVWHKTADEIIERLGRYCADVTNTQLHNEPS